MTVLFVNAGDYVGRSNILGLAGDMNEMVNGQTSRTHTHLETQVTKNLWAHIGENQFSIPSAAGVVFLDIDKQGPRGTQLELWRGEDHYSAASKSLVPLMRYATEVYRKAPRAFREFVDQQVTRGAGKEVQVLTTVVESYRNYTSDPTKSRWIGEQFKAEHFTQLKQSLDAFAKIRLPLSLPFCDVELFKKGIYQFGASARSESEYQRVYESLLKSIH